jgi:hypothetical protein
MKMSFWFSHFRGQLRNSFVAQLSNKIYITKNNLRVAGKVEHKEEGTIYDDDDDDEERRRK